MSSVDIRLNEDFMRNYKTRTLRKRLGAEAILSLQSLWLWAAVNRSEGILYKMTPTKIEGVAEWDGKEGDFFTALVDLEWLDVLEDGTYALHQWVEHQSWAADAANRSDKARLLNMAKNYPELYEELTEKGYTGIDRAAYAELTAEYNSRGILRHSSNFLRTASVSLTPTPTPSPAPIPEPVPVPSTNPIPNPFRPFRPFRTPEPESVSRKTPKKTRKVGAKAPASSSSSFREKESLEILSQTPQAESVTQTVLATPAESKDSIKPEKILVQGVSTEHTETTPTEDSQISETTRAESTTSAEPELSAGQYFSENAVEATVVDILTQWNLQLARLGFPQVLRSTARREAAFKARVHASQERIYLTWWVALFDKIAASDFMCESARQKANWLTLDWVLKEQNMMKILEGKYDSERPVTAEIYNKTFRGRRFSGGKKGTTQATSAQNANVQNAQLQQDASAGGIPEESLRRINEARANLGKPPLSNDTFTAECSEPVVEPEPVTALPEEIERDVPSENLPDEDSSNVENTGCFEGYTAEELAEFDEILAETRAERTAQEAEFEASFNCEEYPAEMSDEEYESYEQELEAIRREQEEYEASMKGADDYYANE